MGIIKVTSNYGCFLTLGQRERLYSKGSFQDKLSDSHPFDSLLSSHRSSHPLHRPNNYQRRTLQTRHCQQHHSHEIYHRTTSTHTYLPNGPGNKAAVVLADCLTKYCSPRVALRVSERASKATDGLVIVSEAASANLFQSSPSSQFHIPTASTATQVRRSSDSVTRAPNV